jgi:hypothetical protein
MQYEAINSVSATNILEEPAVPIFIMKVVAVAPASVLVLSAKLYVILVQMVLVLVFHIFRVSFISDLQLIMSKCLVF